MITFLEQHSGFSFITRGSEYRCKEHPSLAIKSDRLSWYWHSKGVGGYGIIDYLIKIENLHFRQAIENVNGSCTSAIYTQPAEQEKRLILPEKADGAYKRLYAYLKNTRGIDSQIISELIQEKKIYQDTKGNIVFVGYDENNHPRFACLRGTHTEKQFRMDCTGSDKRYGFHMTYCQSEKLYVFEAPIDAMAHATLENILSGNIDAWRKCSRLSLGGTSSLALDKYLESHHVSQLIFCLDNDEAGREASVQMVRKYTDKGYYAHIELPERKDYSDDLIAYKIQNKIY